MSLAPRMFCLDTVMMDVVMMVREVPQPGSDVLAKQGFVTTGGGFNAMSSAARQGMSVVYAGRLGTGPFTDLAREAFDGEDIVAPIKPDPAVDAGFCVVIVDESGERTFLTSQGAEAGLTSDDLHELDVNNGDWVLVSGYNVMYPGLAEMVLEWLAGLDETVVVAFDPSNRVYDIPERYLEAALARTDWLLCNEIEARYLSSEESLGTSVTSLGRLTRRGAVVRRGESGCTVVSGESPPRAVGGFETTVLDTNGAGDTHNGVLVAELARGTETAIAALRANAAASVAISKVGPAHCPTRGEIDEIMRRRVELGD